MKTLLLILIFPVLGFSQWKLKDFDQKNKWFFGAEIGNNTILSNDFVQNNFFQFGLLAEYFVFESWSLQSKIKYYRTEVAFSREPNLLSNGTKPYPTLFFEGHIISIPITANFHFAITNKLSSFVNIGFALHAETKSSYIISGNDNPDLADFPTKYVGFNGGGGIQYAVASKTFLFTSLEFNAGGYKGTKNGLLSIGNHTSMNGLMNFGMKQNFK